MGDIPLQKIFLRSTIYVQNSFNQIGTAFITSKKVGEDSKAIFIVTNKHVLQNKERTKYSDYITARFYKKDTSPDSKVVNIKIPLKVNGDLNNRVFIHPEESIDVAAILISDIVDTHGEIDLVSIDESLLLTREKMKQEAIEAGENVLILGYPAGIFSQENFLPIVKQGILATSPQEDIKLQVGDKIIQGRIILVDASLFGGSSGSPVFVKPRWRVKVNPDTKQQVVQLGEGIPVYLVGIQSSSIELKEKIYINSVKDKLSNREQNYKQDIPTAVIHKDEKGDFFEMTKGVMLNIVFSSEYIFDLFKEFEKRFPPTERKQ